VHTNSSMGAGSALRNRRLSSRSIRRGRRTIGCTSRARQITWAQACTWRETNSALASDLDFEPPAFSWKPRRKAATCPEAEAPSFFFGGGQGGIAGIVPV